MKIAASDYDGTLFRRGRVSREDLEAIAAWRQRGHLFALATGRDLNLTRVEVEERGIPVDYLVCSTGAAVFEPDYRPVHLFSLPPGAAELIIDHPATQDSRYFVFSRAGQTYIDLHSSESWLTGLKLPLTPVDTRQARSLTGLQQISLEFPDAETAARGATALNRDLGPTMYAQLSGFCVDVVPAGATKAEGLSLLIELKKLAVDDVLTIGDSENDLSMLRRFHGYAISGAPEEVLAAARSVADSPAAMLWENLET